MFDVHPDRVPEPLDGELFELVFGDHGFFFRGGFGSFFKSFVACSKSASTARGALAASALNLSYSNSALACAISSEIRPAWVRMSRSFKVRNPCSFSIQSAMCIGTRRIA